ncbi:hypothetical protein B566_EDAN012491 [Ephemera danica]|nr:hypothetical protein B566_EDAN012491 [Ephemera danica]
MRDYLLPSDCGGNNGVNELSDDLRRELEEPLLSGDWVSPGKPEDQALPTTSPSIPPNASPAVAPNTPNAPSVEDAASTPPEEPKRGRGRKRSRGAGAESGSRGPPRKRGPKPVRYCSQIAPETNGIKLRIKKFNSSTTTAAPAQARPPREPRRKRRRARSLRKNHKLYYETSEIREYPDAERAHAWGRCEGPKPSLSFNVEGTTEDGETQGDWGCRLPEIALARIFGHVIDEEGTLPFLVRAARVCRLWRNVAMQPELWRHIDLNAPWVRHAHRNDHTLRWLCENRLSGARDLVLSWMCVNK